MLNDWEYLYERSIGCAGILKDWLVRALVSASRRNPGALTRKDLKAHALSVAQCDKMMSEAVEGETTLLESTEERSRLRTRLGLSPKENRREASEVGNSAPPVEIAVPRRNQRKPGQRKPVRDAVGALGSYANTGTS